MLLLTNTFLYTFSDFTGLVPTVQSVHSLTILFSLTCSDSKLHPDSFIESEGILSDVHPIEKEGP